ncbi:fungal hydrophobin-domain-containing protein [Ampelomyces quisqualis]|uniref:Fungal hydrophobin-domain-containing protein n=1 Tax=Ampelomyces quisqualis TaxID=50730 RepID=A0A6A5QPI5_AMPQU|nr:fungal hydrophobin-domain-containing protein [Ampelomyces quisqualis]
MQYSMILAFAAAAIASPLQERQVGLCATGSPVCCATDVLDLANLDCAPPAISPITINAFIDGCATGGQQAKCCLIPILGQALLCSDVNPTAEAPAAPAA